MGSCGVRAAPMSAPAAAPITAPSAQRSPLWPPTRPPATAPTAAPFPTDGRKICACEVLTPASASETVTRIVFIAIMRRKYPSPIFSQFGDALKNNSVEHFPSEQQERATFRTARLASGRRRFNASDWPNPTNLPTCSTMKDVELSDEMDAVLQRLARKSHQ